MRLLMSVLGLLVVVATIGSLVKRQLASAPAPPSAAQQSQQLQQQYRQAVQEALDQPRRAGDETP